MDRYYFGRTRAFRRSTLSQESNGIPAGFPEEGSVWGKNASGLVAAIKAGGTEKSETDSARSGSAFQADERSFRRTANSTWQEGQTGAGSRFTQASGVAIALLHPLVSLHSHRQFLLLIRISLYQYLCLAETEEYSAEFLSHLDGLACLMRVRCATLATRHLPKLRRKRHSNAIQTCDGSDTSGDARYREST